MFSISKFGKLFHNKEILTHPSLLGKLFFDNSLTDCLTSDNFHHPNFVSKLRIF